MLLKWALMKKVLVSLLDAEGCKSQLTKAQGKDLVILIYNRKYVLLWDVLQHSLWVIRMFFLKKKLALIPWLSIAFHRDPTPCLWLHLEGWKFLTAQTPKRGT